MGFEELTLTLGETTCTVAPARGALVTSLGVAGQEVLFLDRPSFDDASKNVRGGIPVLFPYAGKLDREIFEPAGTTMKQHGFGRNNAWTVTRKTDSSVAMSLTPDAATRAIYPYDFEVEQECLLLARGLQLGMLITNHDSKPLPVSPGWHPYFACPKAQKSAVQVRLDGLDHGLLTDEREFDFGLPAPAKGRTTFRIPDQHPIDLSFSPEMRHLQFWSQPGKDFLCIEPFFGSANTINTPRRLDIPPGESRHLWMRLEVRRSGP